MSRIKSTYVKIDPEKLKNWCQKNGKTYAILSQELGKYDSFISRVLANGEMPERIFRLFQTLFNEQEDSILATSKRGEREPIGTRVGYDIGLTVKPDRVRLCVRFSGQEIYSAWSYIRGNEETDLMQAISYAAHMCYKLSEQKNLGE